MGQVKYLIQAYLLLACLALIFILSKNMLSATPVGNDPVIIDIRKSDAESVVTGKGKQLFNNLCASCHNLFKNMTGPSLCGFEERGPWTDRNSIYQWIRNPAAFIEKNEYARDLKDLYSGAMMTASPHLSDNEIDEIINYINGSCGY